MTRSWVGTITAGSANHSHKHQKLDLKSRRSCKILPYSPHSYFKIFSHKSAHRENLHECHALMVKYEHPGLNFQLFPTLSLLGVPHALETQKSATKTKCFGRAIDSCGVCRGALISWCPWVPRRWSSPGSGNWSAWNMWHVTCCCVFLSSWMCLLVHTDMYI
jgi:hypothetical protein